LALANDASFFMGLETAIGAAAEVAGATDD